MRLNRRIIPTSVCSLFKRLPFHSLILANIFKGARHLIVHPKYQRMGVGRKLLQAVVDRGGADKLPVFVVASLESYNLCKTFGFEDLGGGVINHGRWARVIREKEEKLGLLAHGDEKPEMGHFRELKLQLVKWA